MIPDVSFFVHRLQLEGQAEWVELRGYLKLPQMDVMQVVAIMISPALQL